jgi:hypothetical protein
MGWGTAGDAAWRSEGWGVVRRSMGGAAGDGRGDEVEWGRWTALQRAEPTTARGRVRIFF